MPANDVLAIAPVARPVDATVELPGSKSYTNRALLLAALADGRSTIRRALFSDDTRYMAGALDRLGVAVQADEAAATYVVEGAGGAIPADQADLFVGNSGTAARFLIAVLTLGRGRYTLDGVERMRERPVQPLLEGLQALGARARSVRGNGCPPVEVSAAGLRGGSAEMDGTVSSQFFSAILMVAPLAAHDVALTVRGDLVSKPYIDLTAASMAAFGAHFENDGYRRFRVAAGQRYRARDYDVEPDASAASYFFAAAALTGGRVRVEHLGGGSAQGDLGFVDVLARMGCRVSRGADFVEVQGPATLGGVDADMNALSDTAQTLAAIAPLAAEPVTIRNVGHVRHKETDRIAALVAELRRLGVRADERADGLTVYPSPVRPGTVETYDDHRMAMSFAILGLRAPGIAIRNPGCVAKTFPDFFERLAILAPGAIRG
ncbi:MAG: 3-phosphoshikimate 1-carboxyvinyltransferase [Chloroflexi bacterium]|nr:3-phosphoshikimate 1-carboxyvinyltransferase [Chloroflexota bacterium]